MKKVSIVIPVYNEEAIVSELIDRLQKATSDLPYQFEFILVDDGSTDNTLNLMVEAQKDEGRIKRETIQIFNLRGNCRNPNMSFP